MSGWDEKDQRKISRNLKKVYKAYDKLANAKFESKREERRFKKFCRLVGTKLEEVFDPLSDAAKESAYNDYYDYAVELAEYATDRSTRREFKNDICQDLYDSAVT